MRTLLQTLSQGLQSQNQPRQHSLFHKSDIQAYESVERQGDPVFHIQTLERAGQLDNWSGDTILYRFRQSLTGRALSWARAEVDPYPNRSWDTVSQAFINAMRGPGWERNVRRSFQTIAQRKGESVTDFTFRFTEGFHQQRDVLGAGERYTLNSEVEAYTNALLPQLRATLCRTVLHTFEAAVELAKLVERSDGAPPTPSIPPMTTAPTPMATPARVNALTASNNVNTGEELFKRMAEMVTTFVRTLFAALLPCDDGLAMFSQLRLCGKPFASWCGHVLLSPEQRLSMH